MRNEPEKVIVTFARYRIAVAVMKSLSRCGAKVVAGDSIPWPLGRFSRYCTRYFQYRDPFDDPEGFVDDLIAQAKKVGAKLVVPTFTETQVLARYADRLKAAGLTCMLVPNQTMRLADDKGAVTQLAQKLGLPVPQSWYPESLSNVRDLQTTLPYPVIVKPRNGKAGEGQCIVENPEQLVPVFEAFITANAQTSGQFPIVQKFISGPNIGVAFLFVNGKAQAKCSFEVLRTYQRVHSVERKSTLFPEALASGEALLSHLEWHGIAQLDFILDRETGISYLLEINPRFWGSIGNAIEAGIDLPKYLLMSHRGAGDFASDQQCEDIKSIWFYPYMLSAATALFRGEFKAFSDHIFNPFRRNLRFDDLSVSDPLPSVVEPFLGVLNLLRTGGLALDGARKVVKE